VTNSDAEERAFDLLQWNPYSLPTEYDDELALVGYYSKTQAERSNRALDLHRRRLLFTEQGQGWSLHQTPQTVPG
jgi:hypothetical protein